MELLHNFSLRNSGNFVISCKQPGQAVFFVKIHEEFLRLCLNLERICFTIYAVTKIGGRRKGAGAGKAGWGVLNVVLVEPEIPPNCGNIARTCAATGSRLHLVRPLGFDISQNAIRRNMKRCGLDYWHLVEVADYENLEDLFHRHPEAASEAWLTTTKAPRPYTEARFTPDSWLFFGKETAGLPPDFRERYRERCLRLPMVDGARSLNLGNSAAVLVYEALRQNGFPSLLDTGEMARPHTEGNDYHTNQTSVTSV